MREADKQRKDGLCPSLRRATKQDARALAELVDYAGHGIPGYLWSRSAKEGQSPIEVGIECVLREEANFSYRNAVVAEADGRVAAALLAYRLPEHSDVILDERPASGVVER